MTKRVLIVTALAGFVRSFLMSDIATLQDLGYEVHCAANANHVGADDVLLYLQKHNVHYHQIDFSSNKPLSFKTIKSFYQFWSLVRKNHFEYVHCHTPIAGAICRIILRKQQRKKQVKIIYTTHGFYFHKLSSRKTWLVFYNIENLLSRWTNVIITINKEDFNNAKKMYCKDVRYIPGVGVDLDRFHNVTIDISDYRSSLGLRDEDFVVLAIGEISQRKNQKVVIKALAKAKIPNSVLLICGADMAGGATKQELEYTANKNNVRVQFLGLRKDIPEICKCADVGVLSSTREGLGLAGIEMLAAGLPVIGSKVQGISDYIHNGINGILCDPNSPDDFCNALLLLSDETTREHFSTHTWESVQQFSLSNSKKNMRQIYDEVLSGQIR